MNLTQKLYIYHSIFILLFFKFYFCKICLILLYFIYLFSYFSFQPPTKCIIFIFTVYVTYSFFNFVFDYSISIYLFPNHFINFLFI